MTYFQHHIIIHWCNTRVLLHRVSIVNAKPSKSMAPPFPATTSSETSNCQGSGECTEVFYRGVCRRRRSLQYQPQRAPRVWVRKKIQFIAVLSSAPVVWDKSEKSPRRHCRIGGHDFCWPAGLTRFRIRGENPWSRWTAVFEGAKSMGLRGVYSSTGSLFLVTDLRVESMKKERKKTTH